MSGAPPWLSIVGIGADGLDGLSATAAARIDAARHIFGGARHLASVPKLPHVTHHVWTRPLSDSFEKVAQCRGTPTVVLASGDPFHYGVGVSLSAFFASDEMAIFPAPSSVSLACARLGWAGQETRVLSICGRDVALVQPHLQPGAQLVILSADRHSPKQLLGHLQRHGFGESDVTLMENLGSAHERMICVRAHDDLPADIADVNLMAIRVKALRGALVIPLASGLPDDYFLHDGQLTKREIRAVTMSALAPTQGACLWDVGAGSGAVGIEWMLRHPANRAVAFEKNPTRLTRIAENARRLGVPDLAIVQGELPGDDTQYADPDAIFIGGGVSQRGMLTWAYQRLRPGGRLVANAVTIEGEQALTAAYHDWGGSMTRLSIARAEPIGGFSGFRPAMTVTQYCVTTS